VDRQADNFLPKPEFGKESMTSPYPLLTKEGVKAFDFDSISPLLGGRLSLPAYGGRGSYAYFL